MDTSGDIVFCSNYSFLSMAKVSPKYFMHISESQDFIKTFQKKIGKYNWNSGFSDVLVDPFC